MTHPLSYLGYFIIAMVGMLCGYVHPSQWNVGDWIAVTVVAAVFVRCGLLEAERRGAA